MGDKDVSVGPCVPGEHEDSSKRASLGWMLRSLAERLCTSMQLSSGGKTLVEWCTTRQLHLLEYRSVQPSISSYRIRWPLDIGRDPGGFLRIGRLERESKLEHH